MKLKVVSSRDSETVRSQNIEQHLSKLMIVKLFRNLFQFILIQRS